MIVSESRVALKRFAVSGVGVQNLIESPAGALLAALVDVEIGELEFGVVLIRMRLENRVQCAPRVRVVMQPNLRPSLTQRVLNI